MFYLGYLLPEFGPHLCVRVARHCWVTIGFLCLCLAAWLLGRHLPAKLIFEAFGAAGLLAAVMYGPPFKVYRLLDSTVVKFYGRISYSFYLLHMNAMFALAALMLAGIPATMVTANPLLSNFIVFVSSMALVTPLAWLLHRYVEKPFIAWSKSICSNYMPARSAVISSAAAHPTAEAA